MAVTRRQRQILNFIAGFTALNGYAPSLREIKDHLGLSSVATVHKHVDNLRRQGLLEKEANRARALELIGPAAQGEEVVTILPVVGIVAAGLPMEAVEDMEPVAVPGFLAGNRDAQRFVLRVKGDSMIDAHIADGDWVVVEKRHAPRPGDMVIALIDGRDVTLKRFYPKGRKVRLEPENKAVEPIEIDAEEVHILGVVVGVMRRY